MAFWRVAVSPVALMLHATLVQAILQQEQVLVVTRHGIRVPYPPLANLSYDLFSNDGEHKWITNVSDWGADIVAALTEHGENVIKEMGTYFRSSMLNSTAGDANRFTIYSAVDSTKRDIRTAISFFQGAMPDAEVTEKSMYGPNDANQEDYVKKLMSQGEFSAPHCPSSATLPDVIRGETGGDLTAISRVHETSIMALNDELNCCNPQLCKHQGNSSYGDHCTFMSLPTRWEGGALYWEDFTGPLTVSGKLMEYLQLLYLNNMSWRQVVPSMTEQQLASLMHLHEASVDLASEYWNARNVGSEFLVHIAATMEQFVSGKTVEGLKSRPDDTFVYYAAHDINIMFIRQLLRLNWLTDSYYMNQVPPGGMLIFVLYSSPATASASKAFFVKAYFMTQSMRQQREQTHLTDDDPASRVFAVIPGCADGPELSCPFEDFKRLVMKEIKETCVELVDPNVLSAGPSQRMGSLVV